MKLNNLTANPGATKKATRRGRGAGSGLGKTAGRGHKGQKSRSGYASRWGFEGGQTPLFRRLPKRGFNNNSFAKAYVEIPLGKLQAFEDGTVVTLESIQEANILKFPKKNDGMKVIGGGGEFNRKLTVQAAKFTASAKEAIENAGGKAEEV
jgi:large subunit ribosomal protein L15